MTGPSSFPYSTHHPFLPAPLYDLGLTSPVSMLSFHAENDAVLPLPSPSDIDASQANIDSALDQLLGLEPGSPSSPGAIGFQSDVCTTPGPLSAEGLEFDVDIFDVTMAQSAPPSSIGTVDSGAYKRSPQDNLVRNHVSGRETSYNEACDFARSG